jgi:SAM-dependent methyltransferase
MQATIYNDGDYLKHNPTWHEQDSPWKARRIRAMLRKHGLVPRSVCEVGCGAGGILSCLADDLGAEARLVGFDISPQAFALSRAKARRNLEFVLGDAFFEDPRLTYDVALAIDVFEHVEDCYGFLRNFRATGVHKVFHIPLDLSVQSVLRGSPMKHRAAIGHIHYFTKETALATLRDTGYEVVDHVYTAGALELAKGLKANLMKLPRKACFAIHKDMTVRVLGGWSLLVLAK